ncbi:MAG: ATP phosphoribosyltransferase regulatory subunit, partial [Candidatus Omnitrophica bacterium]|nr:ATP phosphoribosyltransferase regulatory subunit [Candidatus Omnitrophota bacterium]
MFRKLTGTRDILPEEVFYWQKIEEIARRIFSLYHYREIRTPFIEETLLFNRSLGDFSEVVKKQLFLLNDRNYTLRPEATASVA